MPGLQFKKKKLFKVPSFPKDLDEHILCQKYIFWVNKQKSSNSNIWSYFGKQKSCWFKICSDQEVTFLYSISPQSNTECGQNMYLKQKLQNKNILIIILEIIIPEIQDLLHFWWILQEFASICAFYCYCSFILFKMANAFHNLIIFVIPLLTSYYY